MNTGEGGVSHTGNWGGPGQGEDAWHREPAITNGWASSYEGQPRPGWAAGKVQEQEEKESRVAEKEKKARKKRREKENKTK